MKWLEFTLGRKIALNKKAVIKALISSVLVFITGLISLNFYNSTLPNAYEVFVNGNPIAYVRDKDDFIKLNNVTQEGLKEKYKDITFDNSISFEKVRVDDNMITKYEKLKELCKNINKYQVEAVIVKIDGKEIAVLKDKSEMNSFINSIKDYYISKSGIEKVTKVSLTSNITYCIGKREIEKIGDTKEVVDRILSYNKSNPIISFNIEGIIGKEEKISPSVVMLSTDSLNKGENKLQSSGKDGKKIVQHSVIALNDKIISDNKVSEKVVLKPQDRVVLYGTKIPKVVSSMNINLPSRGTITSNFGMRWGKMHYGIDIGADIGTSIYAAIEGKVVFAGFETGYGNVVKLQHSNDLMTIYGHCSRLLIKASQYVSKGSKIAEVGNTGNSTGPHLHFEVRRDGVPINPINFLN